MSEAAPTTPKDRAVDAAGGQSELARQLGVTRSAISQWDKIPMDRVFEVAAITGIAPHELRPDRIPTPEAIAS
jgi:DNA-binding transcriptional regulator YdaS (Cro superfamily)